MKTIKPTKDNIGRLWFELPGTDNRVDLVLPDYWLNWTLWETRVEMRTFHRFRTTRTMSSKV